MLRIVIGGQLAKEEIMRAVNAVCSDPNRLTCVITGDMDAAMEIKNGTADIYLGACDTGGGGALAMAIAIIGYSNCLTVSMPGKSLSDEEICKGIDEGKKAFGMVPVDVNRIVPVIINHLLKTDKEVQE